MGIACSKFSQAQRTALIHITLGVDDVGQFVPGLWNRRAKARGALRELEKAGHIVRDGRRLLLIESSFAHLSEPPSTKQLLFPEEPLLGTALAEVSRVPGDAEKCCPVPDRTLCPSSDGRPVLSETGRDSPQSTPMSCAQSDSGHTRSSKGTKNKFDRFDDRAGSSQDGVSASDELHRQAALERLAKNGRLVALRGELLRRKTPTAMRFWKLLQVRPFEAARIVQDLGDKRNPGAYLNRVLCTIEGL